MQASSMRVAISSATLLVSLAVSPEGLKYNPTTLLIMDSPYKKSILYISIH